MGNSNLEQEYIFLDKSVVPTEELLEEAYPKTYKYWVEIQEEVKKTCGNTIPEWKFYSKKYGWTRKTMLKKRNLFFFQPYKTHFNLTYIFGDKAIVEIEKSDITQKIIEELLAAKKYAEGRGISIPIIKKSVLKDIYKLLEIKVKN